jgi:thioredoxin 1
MSTDSIKTVTGETFSPMVLQGEGPIAVEFMSYGCAYCRALEPGLQEVAARLRAREKIFRVNVAVEPDLAETYGIQGTPTIVLFLDGAEVERIQGPPPSGAPLLNAITAPFQS